MNLPRTVDEYLDRLVGALAIDGKTTRRVLYETEDHLESSIEAKLTAGMNQAEAEQTAMAEFGYPEMIARRYSQALFSTYLSYVGKLLMVLLLTAGLIFIATGISGAAAFVAGEIRGQDFIATPVPLTQLSADRCIHILQANTDDLSECQSVVLSRDYRTVVESRLAGFLIGGLFLVSFFLARNILKTARNKPERPSVLPEITGLIAMAGVLYFFLFSDQPDHRFPGGQATGEMMTWALVFGTGALAYFVLLTRKVMIRHRLSTGTE